MRQRSCQTALRVARVPRGIRAMPAKEKPRVSRGDDFFYAFEAYAVIFIWTNRGKKCYNIKILYKMVKREKDALGGKV